MAKSKETFNKKQRETNRLKQLQDKKQKAEERKANKQKGSLENMIAYVDENGNLSDTPPDPRKRKEYKQEDIQVGVPKHEAQEVLPRSGTVIFFNHAKGFGFINDTETGERIFFHVNDLLEEVGETDKVEFHVMQGPRGPNAVQVIRKK